MNAGRILCSILLGMYAIYIIRNNTITIAGANTKRSLLLTMIQLGQLLMLELMVIFGGRILHSFSIFVNDTLRMYKNDDIRMYNFNCITDTIVEVITTCNTYTLLTVHLL